MKKFLLLLAVLSLTACGDAGTSVKRKEFKQDGVVCYTLTSNAFDQSFWGKQGIGGISCVKVDN